jgi:DNA-binding response OmpR family regulator
VSQLIVDDLQLDLETRTVARAGREIDLSTREFDLLATLMRRPRRVFTREELQDLVWGAERDITLGTVETYICYVRAKIDAGAPKKLVRTIRGVGYTLTDR